MEPCWEERIGRERSVGEDLGPPELIYDGQVPAIRRR
jgi:hypothetical protein